MIVLQEKLAYRFDADSHRIALEYGDLQVTYHELRRYVARVARWLENEKIEEGQLIGLYLEDKIQFITALLGVLFHRCVFVPLDPAQPVKRIGQMIDALQLSLVISTHSGSQIISGIRPADAHPLRWLDIATVSSSPNSLDADLPIHRPCSLDDHIYIFFTSGTTGEPKAFTGINKSLVHFLEWEISTFSISEADHISQFSAPGFDAFLRDLFVPLIRGARLCIPPSRELILNPIDLPLWLERRQIKLIHCVPAVFRVLEPQSLYPHSFPALKYILMAGEQLNPSHLADWFRLFHSRIQLVNLYGTSETTMAKTCYMIQEDDVQLERIPVGKAIKGARVILLDHQLNICPKGVTGEIYIRTPYRTAGYYNDPQLTARRFVVNPFTNDPNDLLNRTGDLGRILPDGNLIVLGRIDRQISIRGARVELSEIEHRLLKHPEVKEAVVILKTDDQQDDYLCAYIVPCHQGPENVSTLRLSRFLQEDLPPYMVPSFFVILQRFPLTPNGKIDTSALPEPDRAASLTPEHHSPRNTLESQLARLWSELLTIPIQSIGIDDHFFQRGGHSLKATVLISKIHSHLNVKLQLAQIFQYPTVREQADLIARTQPEKYAPIEPVETRDYYPLSPAQERLYILQQMDPDSTVYNMIYSAPMVGTLDLEAIERAFDTLIQRHEMLRTSFFTMNHRPVQQVHAQVRFQLQQLPDHSLPEEMIRPFDLTAAPLLRAAVIPVDNKHYRIVTDMHHIIGDGVSYTILIEEFKALMAGAQLQPLTIQYKDFACWWHDSYEADIIRKQRDYWLSQFDSPATPLQLPYDFPRPPVKRFSGKTLTFEISTLHTGQLKKLAADTQTTLYILLLSIFKLLLSKLANQQDITIGTIVAGRRHADLQHIIGMFVNTLPLRTNLNPRETFIQYVNHVKDRVLDAFTNQDYPFEDLVRQLDIQRDASRNPLFDVLFTLQNMQDPLNQTSTSSDPQEDTYKRTTSKFDLTLSAVEWQDMIYCSWNYSTQLFTEDTSRRFIDYFTTAIATIVADSTQTLSEVSLLTPEQRHQVLFSFNNTRHEYPAHQTIHRMFREQAKRTPHLIAVTGDHFSFSGFEISLTYRCLDRQSDRLAAALLESGVKPHDIVAVKMPRSVDTIIALLAILKTGSAYLPIDPDTPGERVQYMLDDSNATLCIDLQLYSSLFNKEKNSLPEIGEPIDPAYIIYTSGTTGRPKGVIIQHNSVLNVVSWFARSYGVQPGVHLIQMSSYTFDASVNQIFGTLLHGAELHIVSKEIILDLEQMRQYIDVHQIHIINFVPQYLERLLSQLPKLKSLHTVLSGAETLDLNVKERIVAAGYTLYNHYGPTEATIDTLAFLCSKDRPVYLGRPISNYICYILDSYLQLQPIGLTGELYISGPGLARGYLNRPQFTWERFGFYQSQRTYKTGDLARWLPDGNIQFIGRIDHQVKIRGYRIELGEIEAVLLQDASIAEAVVTVCERDAGDLYLAAFVRVKENAPNVTALTLNRRLQDRLPHYMVPDAVEILDEMPYSPNGKIDRDALPQPQPLAGQLPYTAPRDFIEIHLTRIWADVLKVPQSSIGIDSNFFQLGGHSMKATILLSRVHKEFNAKIPLAHLFQSPNIRSMARDIRDTSTDPYISLEPLEQREYYPLSPAQKQLFILHRMDPSSIAYNMPKIVPLEGDYQPQQMAQAAQMLIQRHETLRTSFHLINRQPLQKIHATVSFEFQYREIDLSQQQQVIDDFIRPFQLDCAPLFRAALIKIGSHRFILMVDLHHIISDGVSQQILTDEAMSLYQGKELLPLRLHYKDYALWRNRRTVEGEIKKQEDFWLTQFDTPVPLLNLPTDYPRPQTLTFEGARDTFALEPKQAEFLSKIALEEDCTLFILLLALFYILIAKLSDQEDIVIGTVIAGRDHPDLEKIIGMFVNTLALRNNPAGEKTFLSFLKEVKQRTLNAFDNQEYQFESLVEKVANQRDTGRNPLFDVLFSFFAVEPSAENEDQTEFIEENSHQDMQAKFDLTLTGGGNRERIQLAFIYRTALFKQETILRYEGYLKNIIDAVIRDINVPLESITIEDASRFVEADKSIYSESDSDFDF